MTRHGEEEDVVVAPPPLQLTKSKVVEEFLDRSMEKCVEVWIQAALVLCDPALIHERMLLVPTETILVLMAT